MRNGIGMKLLGTLALLATIGSGSAYASCSYTATEPESGCWFPMSGHGYHVKYVVYDLRPDKLQIQVHLNEYPSRDFLYAMNTSDLAALSRANAVYASLLAARASGDYVVLFLTSGSLGTSGSPFTFSSVQVGEN
jgi:hypothetical protein